MGFFAEGVASVAVRTEWGPLLAVGLQWSFWLQGETGLGLGEGIRMEISQLALGKGLMEEE